MSAMEGFARVSAMRGFARVSAMGGVARVSAMEGFARVSAMGGLNATAWRVHGNRDPRRFAGRGMAPYLETQSQMLAGS